MGYLDQIAYYRGERSETPNQALAAILAQRRDAQGVQEMVSGCVNKNASVRSDCCKVLYEVGYLEPELIAPHVGVFIRLLEHKQNRMVWGGMIALSTIADLVPDQIMPHVDLIRQTIETGTVITNVSGVKVIMGLCRAGEPYYSELIDALLDYQDTCRDIDFAKRAEDMWPVIGSEHRELFAAILESRQPDLSNAAQKRVQRVLNKLYREEN